MAASDYLNNKQVDIVSKFKKSRSLPQYVLEGMLHEARNHPTPESFQRDFSLNSMQGVYAHITDNPNFTVDTNKAPTDYVAGGSGGPGLMVSRDPENWDQVFNEPSEAGAGFSGPRNERRTHLAIVTLAGAPKGSYQNTSRGFGHEVHVGPEGMKHVQVHSVLPVRKGIKEMNKIHNKTWEILSGGDPVSGGPFKEHLKTIWEHANRKVDR